MQPFIITFIHYLLRFEQNFIKFNNTNITLEIQPRPSRHNLKMTGKQILINSPVQFLGQTGSETVYKPFWQMIIINSCWATRKFNIALEFGGVTSFYLFMIHIRVFPTIARDSCQKSPIIHYRKNVRNISNIAEKLFSLQNYLFLTLK